MTVGTCAPSWGQRVARFASKPSMLFEPWIALARCTGAAATRISGIARIAGGAALLDLLIRIAQAVARDSAEPLAVTRSFRDASDGWPSDWRPSVVRSSAPLGRRLLEGGMSDLGGPPELPSYLVGQPIRVPEPPGGFPPPREPKKPRKKRQGQRNSRAARLPAASLARAGAVIMGVALVVVAILVVLILVQHH